MSPPWREAMAGKLQIYADEEGDREPIAAGPGDASLRTKL
jgi:hypothetical protein